MVWSHKAAFEQGNATKTSSAEWNPGLSVNAVAGDVVIAGFTMDNAASDGPTVAISKPANETGEWVHVKMFTNESAGSTATAYISYLKSTVNWSNFQPVFTLSTAVSAKACTFATFTGGPAQMVMAAGSSFTTGTNVVGRANASASSTFVQGPIPAGSLVVSVQTRETNAAVAGSSATDGGGTWTHLTSRFTSGGGAASNVSEIVSWKVTTTPIASGSSMSMVTTNVADGGMAFFVMSPTELSGPPVDPPPASPVFSGWGIPI